MKILAIAALILGMLELAQAEPASHCNDKVIPEIV
jgi:hypothetical protein